MKFKVTKYTSIYTNLSYCSYRFKLFNLSILLTLSNAGDLLFRVNLTIHYFFVFLSSSTDKFIKCRFK